MSEQWLSIVEYARKYNISDMTVRRRIKTGKLQAVLRDGKYFIPTAAQEPAAPQRPPQPAPQVVKSHPSPQQHAPVAEHQRQNYESGRGQVTPNFVPHSITSQMRDHHTTTSSVDANTLLAFCEGALKKFSDAEIRLEQQYQQKIGQLEAQLQAKQTEIGQLSQQLEDLQVLVKILERKAGRSD